MYQLEGEAPFVGIFPSDAADYPSKHKADYPTKHKADFPSEYEPEGQASLPEASGDSEYPAIHPKISLFEPRRGAQGPLILPVGQASAR